MITNNYQNHTTTRSKRVEEMIKHVFSEVQTLCILSPISRPWIPWVEGLGLKISVTGWGIAADGRRHEALEPQPEIYNFGLCHCIPLSKARRCVAMWIFFLFINPACASRSATQLALDAFLASCSPKLLHSLQIFAYAYSRQYASLCFAESFELSFFPAPQLVFPESQWIWNRLVMFSSSFSSFLCVSPNWEFPPWGIRVRQGHWSVQRWWDGEQKLRKLALFLYTMQ